ncbi:MAG: ComEC/Rec2 family competence protein [Clostridiales bacterium]|jgi:ComEC/Rec2-related protein|nr:ComEC/Rec2 family competence protein [Clostridiales bacterium]
MSVMKKGAKSFNYRFYAAAALMLIGGIFTAVFLDFAYSAFFALAALFLFKKRRGFVVFFIIGALYVPIAKNAYAKKAPEGRIYAEVYGQIDGLIFDEGDGACKFVIKDVLIGGEKYPGRASVKMYADVVITGAELKQGNTVHFAGGVSKNKLDPTVSIGVSMYNHGIYYSVDAYYIAVVGEPKSGGAPAFRQKIFEGLSEYLSREQAGYAYALIFGDDTEMSGELIAAYRNTGLAHAYAVSGLHFTFLFAALSAVFNLKMFKTKARKIKDLIAFAAFLAFAYACGFSPSVTRSIIMITVYMYAGRAGRKNDGLNSLCFAAVVILLSNPFYIMDLGFLLSFSGLLGLILFSKTFSHTFTAIENKIMPRILRGYPTGEERDGKTADKNAERYLKRGKAETGAKEGNIETNLNDRDSELTLRNANERYPINTNTESGLKDGNAESRLKDRNVKTNLNDRNIESRVKEGNTETNPRYESAEADLNDGKTEKDLKNKNSERYLKEVNAALNSQYENTVQYLKDVNAALNSRKIDVEKHLKSFNSKKSENEKENLPRSVKAAKKLAGAVKESLAMTFAANIGVFPILCIYFGGIPLVSFVSNLFVVPAVSILFPYLLTVGIAAMFIPPLNLFFLPARTVIDWINGAVYFFSRSPFFITDGFLNVWTSIFGEGSAFWFAVLYYALLVYLSNVYIGPKLYLRKRIKKFFKKKE